MAIAVLHDTGEPIAQIGRRLGVDESTVRYHLNRQKTGATDGRVKPTRVEQLGLQAAVVHWWEQACSALPTGRRPNAEELHEWLVNEHGYDASVKSLRVYLRRTVDPLPLRPFRRVETPPGAQAQVDWSEHRGIDLDDGEGPRTLYVFHLVLSHSRKQVDVVCLGCNQLWWHHAHLEAFKRIGGVPASVRIDNCKTGIAHGAGAWGMVNQAYEGFARSLGFLVDPCPVRQPRAKGKVERGVRTFRLLDIQRMARLGLEALQGWCDQQAVRRSERFRNPVTGTTVQDAWKAEARLLQQLPHPCPAPFDVVIERRVRMDCLVCAEGRQYSVPFIYCDQIVEVRGCAEHLQFIDRSTGALIKQWPRATKRRILIDPADYEGEGTERVHAPVPLGRMGRCLTQLSAEEEAPQRSVAIYARLVDALGASA